MFSRLPVFLLSILVLGNACGGCGDDNNDPNPDMSVSDMQNTNGDTGETDMGGAPDGGEDPDMGGPIVDEVVVTCDQNTWAPPAEGLCDASAGTGDATLFQVGTVLTNDAVYKNGTVLVSGSGENATIACVGCDCAAEAQGATTVTCADGTLSPALINPHDHITFSLSWPQEHGTERFDHRHDWRRGLRGHNEVGTNPGSDPSREGILYGELRMLFGGAASIAGSGSTPGLLRNLDDASDNGGLTGVDVDYRTFPLGDSNGTLNSSGCDYPNVDAPTRAANAPIYLPHIAEGIDEEAQNEFRCLSSSDGGGTDLVGPNTSIIHGIGLTLTDIATMAAEGAKLVWSPRSNIDLYGNTARVTAFKSFGATIALGTDWSASGSANMLRELKCADFLNSDYYNNTFTDRELWQMATYNAAVAMGADTQIGAIAEGFVADLALFDGRVGENYRAVIDAANENVHLVMRGGTPLYGDKNVIEALVPAAEVGQCEEIDICGQQRRLCVERDTGLTRSAIANAVNQNAYAQFFCEEPPREPSCVPLRPDEYEGTSATDTDGDGIDDAEDLCPAVFTPVRPMDGAMQNDLDEDAIGDDCDTCPLSADGTCMMLDPNDRDADGVPNTSDNCPADPNADQANADNDPYGDVCDPCPDFDNSASAACPTTIYDIRAGAYGVGDSVALDEVIVTAVSDRAYFVQVPDSASYYSGLDFSGLYVFGAAMDALPAVGDIIAVEGRLDLFGDTLEIVSPVMTVQSSGNTLPPFTEVSTTDIATGGARAAALEGTLVRVRDVTVTSQNPDAPDDFGVFEVDGLQVDDVFFAVTPRPDVGEEFSILQGVLTFSFGNSKLLPRDSGDVVTGPPALRELSPAEVFLRTGAPSSPPLEILLTGPSLGVTTVNLAYTGGVAGPASIDIPDGESSAVVPITASGAQNGTVTATLGGDSDVSNVTIYSDLTVRTVDSVTPANSNLTVNATGTFTVNLDVPAPSSGSIVLLGTTGGLTAPASVTVPADALSATFDVTAGANAGAGTITATLGVSNATANVTVIAGTPDCLIISEMIEGSGSNNKAFELYNCSGGDLDLSGFGICLVSNGNTSCTASAGLPSMTLGNEAVFTVCRTKSGSDPDPVTGISTNCDLESGSVSNFNGNDRIVVFKDADNNDQFSGADTVIDVFGDIATDPGSIWANMTYRRCDFTPHDGAGGFDVAATYTAHAQNDASDYGVAPVEGCP